MMRTILIACFLALPWCTAIGHESWINESQFRNKAGEFCCGHDDCFVVHGVTPVSLPTAGFRLPSGEFVPQSEATPSPDGFYWRCQKSDGTRRCFFYPPMGF